MLVNLNEKGKNGRQRERGEKIKKERGKKIKNTKGIGCVFF